MSDPYAWHDVAEMCKRAAMPTIDLTPHLQGGDITITVTAKPPLYRTLTRIRRRSLWDRVGDWLECGW